MATTEAGDVRQLSASDADSSVDFERSIRGVIVRTSADVYIDFDHAATTGGSFLVKAADDPVFFPVQCTEVHAITSSGSATVYVVGVR